MIPSFFPDQLEDELAAEKYKYNLQKAAEDKQKKEKQKQGRIRVFKIKPHNSAPKLNTGMVEWKSSQVAKSSNSANGDQALSQLEDELAAEKYKYNLQKAAEEKQRKEKQKQGRIRVFKIKPHKSAPKLYTGMVEWQSSQPLATTTDPTYRGPPASAPISEEQLNNKRKYATKQVAYHSESRPVTLPDSAYGDQALSQLEDELAAEKYKYNLQKAAEEMQKRICRSRGKIRVFKIKPHKSAPKLNTGMVEWQSSQVAKCEFLSNFDCRNLYWFVYYKAS
ncbi:hypothetical protein CAEBREN_21000 [Caenorhabditis brenneri]|uniref:Uncharacterized protein n=1 Tax=Caenorhabditis brenneri TaxID=135651 RepID=G0N6D0_CAEBE|nr:hypothetical protein CAEBREN_21000 [Caenorhabditis brenneri]